VRGTPGINEGIPSGNWPWAIQLGFSFDRTFTDALVASLNLLEENNQADIISNPKVVAQDGQLSQIRAVTEEWFMMTGPVTNQYMFTQSQLEKVESGTVLTITPHIGDNNDITLEMAVEVSDSIPRGRGSDLPVVTRRTARNRVTIRDGGTVAVAGLTENRSRHKDSSVPGFSGLPLIGGLFRNKDHDDATREIAVFVTAHMVPEVGQVAGGGFSAPMDGGPTAVQPSREEFNQKLRESLSRRVE